MTYGSGGSNIRLVGGSEPSQGVERVCVGEAAESSRHRDLEALARRLLHLRTASVLQAATDRPVAPRAVERWLTVGEVAAAAREQGHRVRTVQAAQLRHARVANAIRIAEQALGDLGGDDE